MAEAFLQILLENITSFIQGELGLLLGFENDFENISSRFSTIQAVLEDAQEKQLKDKAIKNWLPKLNAAAYKVDNLLDECKYEAARLKQSRLGRYHPKTIAFRHKIGKMIKEMMEKLDAIAKERTDFHLHEKIIERQVARPETGLVKKEGGEQFPVLEEMEIRYCPILTLSSNLRALTSLNISDNEEDTSLPEEMFNSLANLKYLNISDFNNLKELPTSLASLNALKSLQFEFCDALESLPEEGVKGLTSLTELFVTSCKMLKCLPEGLQHLTALTTLTIRRCPTLAKRCEEGIGEDWHKIAHIPNVEIYSQVLFVIVSLFASLFGSCHCDCM